MNIKGNNYSEQMEFLYQSVHCKTVDEALAAYDKLNSKVVAVNFQIHAGGRCKEIYTPRSLEI